MSSGDPNDEGWYERLLRAELGKFGLWTSTRADGSCAFVRKVEREGKFMSLFHCKFDDVEDVGLLVHRPLERRQGSLEGMLAVIAYDDSGPLHDFVAVMEALYPGQTSVKVEKRAH